MIFTTQEISDVDSGAQKRRNTARASQHHALMAEIVCSYDDAVLPVNGPWPQIVADVPSPSTPPGLCLATPPNPPLSRSLKKPGPPKRAGVRTRGHAGASPSQRVCAQNRGSEHKTGLTTARGRSSGRALLAAARGPNRRSTRRSARPVPSSARELWQAGEPALSRCRGGPCQRSAQVLRRPGTAAGEGKGG
jgi:hypothetical protein